MSSVFVRPRARLFRGHPWVLRHEVDHVTGEPRKGSLVTLKDKKNRILGTAIYNPESQIVARRISHRKERLDLDFFRRRLRRAAGWREKLPEIDPKLCRLVWSEADGLPGVIVDRYGEVLVLQQLTAAMDQAGAALVEALVEVFRPAAIIARNDAPVRRAEGLELVREVVHGAEPEPFEVDHRGLKLRVDLRAGQKTGLYLDQLDNWEQLAAHAAGKRVLDLFCNQGGFGLRAAQAGASAVLGVDISEDAVAAAAANAERNGLTDRCRFQSANCFDFLTGLEPELAWDIVVLDPPSFAPRKDKVAAALRGYKDLHLRVLRHLRPGGILATYSCSHHIDHDTFLEMIRDAAHDAKTGLRLLAAAPQRRDHPVDPLMPESEYLRGFLFEVVGGY